MKRQLLIVCAIAGLAAAGCGGTGQQSTLPGHPLPAATDRGTAQAQFRILVPIASTSTSSSKRSPAYVSPATGSVSFQVPSMSAPEIIALTLGSGNCPEEDGGYVCSTTFTAPIGDDQPLTVETFGNASGSGTPLSQNTIDIDVASSGNNPVTVTLNGVAAAIGLVLDPDIVAEGTASTVVAHANLLDSSGYTIVGPGTPTDVDGNPLGTLTLATSDTTDFEIGAYDSSNGTFSVQYDGGTYTSPVTFTLSLPTFTNAVATIYSAATPTPSPTPTGTALADPCLQTPSPDAPAGLSAVNTTFFNTIVPASKNICISAWDLSGNIDAALETALRNGANVWVITPYSEKSSNSSDLATLTADGAIADYEYTGSASPAPINANYTSTKAPMDIHAKFALIDGVAYMDGHNWFTTDVVMRDGSAGDFDAMQTDLATFPNSPPSNGAFTTDKQLSLQAEAAYINGQDITAGQEYDFITESFNPNPSGDEYNDDVYDAMCQVAVNQATIHVQVEEYSGYSSAAKAALQNLMLLDPNASVHTESSGGLEKISMVRGASTVWFGSSNATTTDLFDWGMTLSDPGVISALQTYFDGVYNASSSIPTPAPGATASPCP